MADTPTSSYGNWFNTILGTAGSAYTSSQATAQSLAETRRKEAELKAAQLAAQGQQTDWKKFLPIGIGAVVILAIIGFVMRSRGK